MQLIRIFSFTGQGSALADKIKGSCSKLLCEHYPGSGEGIDIDALVKDSFSLRLPMLFIGAAGIAVRKIAPYVKDKLSDSAVLVADEAGRFVIPVLSGHVGGANALAKTIAKEIGAEAVITTATDVDGAFAADAFAMENGLKIVNREGIKAVAKKSLAGEEITVAVSSEAKLSDHFMKEIITMPGLTRVTYPPEPGDADIVISNTMDKGLKALLYLKPLPYVIGVGCRKDTPEEKIHEAVKRALALCGLPEDGGEIMALASIDLKAGERGILACAAKMGIPFYTCSAKELAKAKGSFTASDFVEEKTGVDNVCERAAVFYAGPGAELLLKKTAFDGVTVAVARR